jgi:hypothetical protein
MAIPAAQEEGNGLLKITMSKSIFEMILWNMIR